MRVVFETAIRSWMISSWQQNDYGIDGSVEIIEQSLNSTNRKVTGKQFSFQLKSSTELDFDSTYVLLKIAREKIIYWYNSIEPVMLALVDLNKKCCHYLWIEENLIKDLSTKKANWIGLETATLKISTQTIIDRADLFATNSGK